MSGKNKRRGSHAKKSKLSGKIPIIIGVAFLAVAICIAGGIWLHAHNVASDVSDYEYIFPNVYIAGVNVGGLSKEEALQKVSDTVNSSYSVNTLTVRLPDRTLKFTPEQTKFAIDAQEAVDKAYEYGREGDKYDIYKAYTAALDSEHYIDVETDINIDYDGIRQTIDQAAADIESSLVESSYTVTETAIEIHVGAAQRHLDADALYEAVCNAFVNGDFTTIEWDVETKSPGVIDLDSIWKEINVEPADAGFDAETGEITPEVVGCTFDLQSEKQMLSMAEENTDYTIQLQITQPEVTAEMLSGKLFADILGACDSELAGSNYNRTNNVTLVCEAINGTVVNPGEVFSFNGTVGERTEAKGYLEAGVYVSGQTQNQLGGGICQVASTIYLSCLRGNLEIVEREPHEFLVTYVPKGCDATIYWGSYDYKFRNSTDYPIRIDAWVANNYVHVELHGTNVTGEYVEMTSEVISTTAYKEVTEEDPTQPVGYSNVKQYPYTGYEVKSYRNLYDANGNLLETTYEATSNYHKRDQITVVGTKQPEPEPTPSPSPTPEPTPEPIPEPLPEESTAPVDEAPGETTSESLTIVGR